MTLDIIEIAKGAGMQVLLDGQIGHETYHRVCGSLSSLQRFADAVLAATDAQSPAQCDAEDHTR